ncbi:MAG: lipocalin family protein, partial [Candidatus Pacebacteria bacterium]|nr:lipocalin family protein [Candidatus Paceibacterota bacterium]
MAQSNTVGTSVQSASALTAIPSLDVPRYMGTWYEIAKYPNWFQKKCVAGTQAHYALKGRLTTKPNNSQQARSATAVR